MVKKLHRTGYGARCGILAIVATAFLFSSFLPNSALAQSSDVQGLLDRINRLEADLTSVQRKVFQGQDVPAPSSSSSGGGIPAGEAAALLSTRIDGLENEQRRSTGSMEEAIFKIDQLKSRLDKLVLDVDFRLTAIERRLNGSSLDSSSVGSAKMQPAAGKGTNDLPAGSKVLGTLRVPADGGQPVATTNSKNTAQANVVVVPPAENLTAAEKYNRAFSLLNKDDFGGAEEAFSSFLAENKDHKLAGNAQYWLGETFYVRGDYPNAASAFLNGYQTYPDSTKAADNLLKLAMTLGRMEQKEEACATFQQLEKQFSNLSSRLRRISGLERKKFSCS